MTAAVAKTWRFVRKRKTEIVIFIIACLVAVLMIYPLMWMLSTSLKEQFYVYNTGIFYSNWKFGNYVEIFQETMLARAILNSLIVAIPPLVVSNLVCAVAAFAFAKIDFKGRDTVFMIMLSTMMIPFAVVMIPQFVLFKMLGLLSAGAAALTPDNKIVVVTSTGLDESNPNSALNHDERNITIEIENAEVKSVSMVQTTAMSDSWEVESVAGETQRISATLPEVSVMTYIFEVGEVGSGCGSAFDGGMVALIAGVAAVSAMCG